MKTINTVSLIGLGAIGATFVSAMPEGFLRGNLRVIAGGARAERLRRNGVTVNGRVIRVNVSEAGELTEPSDLVVFATKANALLQAMEDARHHVGNGTIILSLLNGISSEELLAERFGSEKVLYSYCVGTDATRAGDEVRCSAFMTIPFGESTNNIGEYSEKVRATADFFDRVGQKYEIPEDMLRSQWWKWMMNMGVNQTLALLRRPYSALTRRDLAWSIARDAMLEAVKIAKLEGVALDEADPERVLAVLDRIDPEGKPSTLQDIEALRTTEVEIFSGSLLKMAEKHGIQLPVNAMLYRLIKAGEQEYE
jgi:2-dehydropantoate 2-reductase